MKAGQLVRALNDERSGRPVVSIQDEGDEHPEFWALLGGAGPVKSAAEGGCDRTHAVSASVSSTPKLFKLSDASGIMSFTKVAEAAKFDPSLLDTNDVMILDTNETVFAWVGKGANKNERREALGAAQKYLTDNHKPSHLPIERISQGNESSAFQALFSSWSGEKADPPDVSSAQHTFQQPQFSGFAGRLNAAPIDDKAWMNAGTRFVFFSSILLFSYFSSISLTFSFSVLLLLVSKILFLNLCSILAMDIFTNIPSKLPG